MKVKVGFTKNNWKDNRPGANEVFSSFSGEKISCTISGKKYFLA